MIGDLDTFIQFLAAIYVTITLDNLLGKRFWSPDFYNMVVDSINHYGFQKSSNIQKKLDSSIKRKAHELEEISRKRGAFMLISCVLLLIYSGFENELNTYIKDNQLQTFVVNFPIFVFLLCVFVGIIFHSKIFSKWSYVIFSSFISIVCVFLTFFVLQYMHDCEFWTILRYIKVYIVFILIIPIIYQLYINWLYSSVYVFHLKKGLNEEYKLYKKAQEALDKNDENVVPNEYKNVFSSLFFQKDKKEDVQVTKIVNCLYERLESTCKPSSSWSLLKIYFSRKKDENINKNDMLNVELVDENLPVTSNKLIEQKTLIEEAYIEYKSLSPKPKISVFCKNKDISEEEFKEYYRKSLSKSSSLKDK